MLEKFKTAVSKWWNEKGKAYVVRALHTAWQVSCGAIVGMLQAYLAGGISWETLYTGIGTAILSSLIKSIIAGVPETTCTTIDKE